MKTAAFAILMRAENVLAWLTPGAQIGLAVGLAVALAAVALPRAAAPALRGGAASWRPPCSSTSRRPIPISRASLKVWQQGHFLNFNGLTRLVSALWPFAALGYLMFLAGAAAGGAAALKSRSMSYYEKHVFFCCNQRDGGRACCNDKGASEMRDYAKKRRSRRSASRARARCASTRPAASIAARKAPAWSCIPRRSGTPTSTSADIDEIIEEHLRHGRVVERLRM